MFIVSSMNIIDRLDAEWAALRASRRMAGALRVWAGEDPVLAFSTLDDLVEAVERREIQTSDAILYALIARAATDDCAARLLVQLLLPGCKALMRGIGSAERDELAAVVAATLFDRIRTYPVARRPSRIAANVLMDVRHRLLRWAADRSRRHVSLHRLPEHAIPAAGAGPEAASEAVALLGWAVRSGQLDAEAARLIALTRLAGLSVATVAAAAGASEQTLRRRRLRAEQRLRAAVQ